jgi:polysaccharide pyruvyl transferase WcaK-like protein
VDIVHELVRWYRCELHLELEVLERPVAPRVLFMGGWSAHRHVGDDAILRAHLRELERRVPSADAVVLADLPDAVSARFGVQAAAGVYAYLHEGITRRTDRRRAVILMTARTLRLIRHARALRRGREAGPLHPTAAELLETLSHADLVVGASAGSLCSRFSLEALWPQAAMALAAAELGVPVLLSRVTLGPFTGIADRMVAVALFHLAAEISIRDRRCSRRELRRLAVFDSRVRETADAAWHLASGPSSVIDRALHEHGIAPDEPLAVLSGHGPDVSRITEQLGAVAGALADQHGFRSLFIPMDTGAAANDEEVASRLASLHGDRLSVLGPLPPDDVIVGIARRARIAIGTRYHLAVFAASGGVPAVGLYTDESERKLRGLSDFAGDLVTSLPAGTPAGDLTAAVGRQLGRGSGTRDLGLVSSAGASWFGPLERLRGVRSGPAPDPPPAVSPPAEGSDGGVEIAEVALAANAEALDALGRFYCGELGIAQAQRADADLAVRIGPACLRFRSAGGAGQPFYHFALLVPGDRFQAARDWLAGHAELLPRPDSTATVFDFDAWEAQACYCHDPAGNIVELIAHRGVAERRESSGGFCAEELAGISELGVVVPSPARAAELLRSELGLELWDGAVDEGGGLGFVGSQAQTLILCAPGRGWLPTGRPASIHPVHVTLTGARPGEVGLPRTPHRIRVRLSP